MPGRKARPAFATMTPVPANDPRQRRAVMRTVWILAAVAATIFAAFIWTATHPQ